MDGFGNETSFEEREKLKIRRFEADMEEGSVQALCFLDKNQRLTRLLKLEIRLGRALNGIGVS